MLRPVIYVQVSNYEMLRDKPLSNPSGVIGATETVKLEPEKFLFKFPFPVIASAPVFFETQGTEVKRAELVIDDDVISELGDTDVKAGNFGGRILDFLGDQCLYMNLLSKSTVNVVLYTAKNEDIPSLVIGEANGDMSGFLKKTSDGLVQTVRLTNPDGEMKLTYSDGTVDVEYTTVKA